MSDILILGSEDGPGLARDITRASLLQQRATAREMARMANRCGLPETAARARSADNGIIALCIMPC